MTTHWSFSRVCTEIASDPDTCLKWCEEHRLIPTERRCSEGHLMMITKYKTHIGQFQCSKRHANGKAIRFSRTRGTVFESKRMSPEKILIMIYCFANDMTYKDCIIESSIDMGTTSKETVWECYSFCRELITHHFLEVAYHATKIGGPGKIVRIEELFLEKRKFNIGPYGEDTDFIVLFDAYSGDFCVEVCPDSVWHSKNLLPLINKHVNKGTIIIPGGSRDYSFVIEDGYSIQNSDYLKSQMTAVTDKTILNISRDCGADKFLEQLFKAVVKKENLDLFEAFLGIVRYRYPVQLPNPEVCNPEGNPDDPDEAC